MVLDSKFKSKRRVLIIDDDPMVRESLDMLFNFYGWEVLTAESGDMVLEALRPIEYQLALVDHRMSGTEGVEVIRELKSRSSAPVFMITGCVDPDIRLAAERVGVDRYFSKPFKTSDMLEALAEMYGGSELS